MRDRSVASHGFIGHPGPRKSVVRSIRHQRSSVAPCVYCRDAWLRCTAWVRHPSPWTSSSLNQSWHAASSAPRVAARSCISGRNARAFRVTFSGAAGACADTRRGKQGGHLASSALVLPPLAASSALGAPDLVMLFRIRVPRRIYLTTVFRKINIQHLGG